MTITDLASKINISKSTISRVLCGDSHVKEETRKKVLEELKKYDFEPNYFAKALKTKKSRTIAFIVPNIEIMIYPALIKAVTKAASERGYTILLCDIQDDKENAYNSVLNLKRRNVDGFIFSTALSNNELNREILAIDKANIPYVNLLRVCDDNKSNAVFLDNYLGSKIGVEYLLKKGKKRILFFKGQEEIKLYRDRYQGYVETLENNNICVDKDLILPAFNGSKYILNEILNEKKEILKSVDAILCASDNIAIDTIHQLHRMNYNIPRDIALLGYDNVPISELFIPRLSVIAQPFSEMGKKAVELLISLIENQSDEKKEYIFKPYLIERETV